MVLTRKIRNLNVLLKYHVSICKLKFQWRFFITVRYFSWGKAYEKLLNFIFCYFKRKKIFVQLMLTIHLLNFILFYQHLKNRKVYCTNIYTLLLDKYIPTPSLVQLETYHGTWKTCASHFCSFDNIGKLANNLPLLALVFAYVQVIYWIVFVGQDQVCGMESAMTVIVVFGASVSLMYIIRQPACKNVMFISTKTQTSWTLDFQLLITSFTSLNSSFKLAYSVTLILDLFS